MPDPLYGQSVSRKPWVVVLVCCGRSDGTYEADTWEEAHAFRNSYMSGPGVGLPDGHERVAIVRKVRS